MSSKVTLTFSKSLMVRLETLVEDIFLTLRLLELFLLGVSNNISREIQISELRSELRSKLGKEVCVWNMVFVGVENAPASHFPNPKLI